MLNKEQKDQYEKNFKYLKKKTKEHIRKWKDFQFSWIGDQPKKNGNLTKRNLQI